MYNNTSVQLKHFIDIALWKEGLNLLEFQVSQTKKNKHYNTLSMYYYESIISDVSQLNSDIYFHERISSDLFYGLEEEFKIFTYLSPKPGLGLRSYKFFSYSLRALYYTIGIYLIKLTQEFLDDFKPRYPQIKTYYGGNLRFNKETLTINANSTYYKKHYIKFRNSIKKSILDAPINKVVLRLDIKDYFDDISIPILLDNVSEYVKSGVQSQMKYDSATKEAITFFFRYLTNDRGGIPQTENDIIGGFIGYLYLTFADFLFYKEIIREDDIIRDHSIIRYMDDIYIVIEFKEDIAINNRETFIDSLSARIADILFYRLRLKLNTKSRLYWLNNNDDLKDLFHNLKKVSQSYYISDSDRENPQSKVENILIELQNLRSSKMGAYFVLESSVEDDVFKEAFDSQVDKILYKPCNIDRLEALFSDFNFDLVKVSPSEITAIMLHSPNLKSAYRDFLLDKKYLTTDDVDLILKYLAQIDFSDQELLEKLKKNKYMKDIVALVTSKSIPITQPGYYDLLENKLSFISQNFHVIEQIRLRAINQKIEAYSVALNHLLNEIHALCLLKDYNNKKSSKDYNANDVTDFLTDIRVDPDVCIKIRNLFDRRNTNQISHPGSLNTVTWGVSKEEYLQYRSYVGQCLNAPL